MTASDRIHVLGIRGTGFHGVLPEERQYGQEFSIDIELRLDLRAAGSTDELSETVDYSALAAATLALIEGEPCSLIETLAERVADMALSHDLVDEVCVTVHKPNAPVGVQFSDVAVTVVRQS